MYYYLCGTTLVPGYPALVFAVSGEPGAAYTGCAFRILFRKGSCFGALLKGDTKEHMLTASHQTAALWEAEVNSVCPYQRIGNMKDGLTAGRVVIASKLKIREFAGCCISYGMLGLGGGNGFVGGPYQSLQICGNLCGNRISFRV